MPDVYPKAMVHPSAQKSVITPTYSERTGLQDGSIGTPDRFPPVTVNNPGQESYYRAQGYIVNGEVPVRSEFHEFPRWLHHKKHEPVLVNSTEEMEERIAAGYFTVGNSDPEAFRRASAVPYVPGRIHREYPKMVNGVVVDPTKKSTFQEFPKWVGDKIANNADEEAVILGFPVIEEDTSPVAAALPKKRGRKPRVHATA